VDLARSQQSTPESPGIFQVTGAASGCGQREASRLQAATTSGLTRRRAYALAVIAVAVLLVLTTLASAAAPSAGDQQCLACHALDGLAKPLADGGTLSLHISGDGFAQSVHAVIGCAGCHTDINLARHPPAKNQIASQRVFSVAMVQVCRTCHNATFEQWTNSVHAALVRDGNPQAPICSSCHTPHAVMQGAAGSLPTVPCKTCHSSIFTAYSTSVHGVIREHGMLAAPLCFDCHGAHDVAVASAGVGRRDVCLGCHTEALASHRSWLPNAQLHFDVVSCSVCHTPRAQRMVNLILYNSATQKEILPGAGIPEFENLSGSAAMPRAGMDPTTLMMLLGALNRQNVEGKTSIRGRLEVRTGIEDHELSLAANAIGSCDTCHRQGAAAFQSVEVSVAGPAGIPIHYDASKDVLSSVLSIDAVGGFYAIGGSRITFLDLLFVLALVGAIGWSAVHFAARWGFSHFGKPPTHGPGKE
jgi:hypothetical protein